MEDLIYLRPKGKGIKLHLCCGDYWGEGYLNIDLNIYGGTDMIYDIRQKLPFQDQVVEIIQAHDAVEHFSYREIDPILDDWYRLLIDGGKVIVTLPDIQAVMSQYQDKPQEALQAIYGMESDHKWGYTKESLKELFEKHNFRNIVVEELENSKDEFPRIRLECER